MPTTSRPGSGRRWRPPRRRRSSPGRRRSGGEPSSGGASGIRRTPSTQHTRALQGRRIGRSTYSTAAPAGPIVVSRDTGTRPALWETPRALSTWNEGRGRLLESTIAFEGEDHQLSSLPDAVLSDITHLLVSEGSPEKVLEAVADALGELVPHDSLILYRAEPALRMIRPVLVRDPVYAEELWAMGPHRYGNGITGVT